MFNRVVNSANRLLFKNLNTKVDEKNKKVRAAAKAHDVKYIDNYQLACDFSDEICFAFTDLGYKTLYDYDHWTLEGAKFFGNRLFKNKGLNVFN